MKTASIGVENLCVPCRAACRYCLLSSCGRATGVSYDKGKSFAARFLSELREKRPDLGSYYYIGYCMDAPDLADYIRFCRETGSPSAKFLQFNGLSLRDERETAELVGMVKAEGVETIDLTFYGTRDYHDRFSGRAGDFDFLLRILAAANRERLAVTASIPLIRENMGQMEELLDTLLAHGLGAFTIFLPHSKGRGGALDGQRLTKREFDTLSDRVKAHFIKARCQTEGEWLRENVWPEPEQRTLTLCLTEENIGRLEAMPAEDIVRFLEELDDNYRAQVPPLAELARLYGNREGERLFRLRDLHLSWQQRYLREHLGIYDMNDECHHFSVHT